MRHQDSILNTDAALKYHKSACVPFRTISASMSTSVSRLVSHRISLKVIASGTALWTTSAT
ncbi:hypothetical protein BpHYR1_013160 [Brachionus plicatilis]|uniref:Uncharacterized protein n=1 Tax=Brachionus plicatilis TaxID=10195 RepID=A0A3M7RQR8_BRAPC|nr:hypothetical protein BpHYR1_013160 [Brachionus plicatilis]